MQRLEPMQLEGQVKTHALTHTGRNAWPTGRSIPVGYALASVVCTRHATAVRALVNEQVVEPGLPADPSVLGGYVEGPSQEIRCVLRRGADSPAVPGPRIRCADGGDAVAMPQANVPAVLLAHLQPAVDALRDARHGILRKKVGQPVMLGAEKTCLLHGSRGRPAIAGERVTRSDRDRPVGLVRSRLRGDRSRHVLELARARRDARAGAFARLAASAAGRIGGCGSLRGVGHCRGRAPGPARRPMGEVMRGQRTDALAVLSVRSSL